MALEWRRRTGDAFVPLGLRAFKGLGEDDEVLSLNWDYLPGGLALAEPGQAVELPGQRPWSRELQDAEGTVEMGMGADTLLRTTQTVKPQADGSFVREEQVTATSGVARAGVRREYDASGRIVGFTRTLDGQSSTCRMTRDALGRVVEMTRPDGSVIKRAYEGFSSHVTQLKVGDQVLATQTLGKDSSLKTRKVGNRNYQYDGDKVTLPDNKTVIDTGTEGQYTVAGQLLSGLSQQGSVSTLACEPTDPAEPGFKTGRWQHSLSATPLPGRQSREESTPRRTVSTFEWQSLRGVAVAAQRADGHCQRLFFDHLGRPLRSWQDHEDLLYRYDDHGRLTERRVQASKAGAQWQILSEHDVFDQETRRTFRHSGRTVFAQSLEWRGDGKLLAKHSEREGKRLRSERYSYDTLERLASYKCEAEQALDCPTDEGARPSKSRPTRGTR
ncbi:hypothetical protein HU719_009200 [Pseudomonas sp. SWRI107]|uniref:RHS repeat domain-containing protein n=1 Tax=Pseudomonas farsensis TaxID=2745492 RepID=UPI001C3C8059|nr:hypothetical protein [Pseudomonas farsensis]